ncbi:MAG: hypothetical protein CSB33_00165 [Desulfobacterales bacterium]|nr:MAG: hypothetical protein CSB33_00165 [Desulfobacterales bacterium]
MEKPARKQELDRPQKRNAEPRHLFPVLVCLGGMFLWIIGSAGGSAWADDPVPPVPVNDLPALSPADEPPPLPTLDAPSRIIEEDGRTYYIVQTGDTLWGISQKFLDSPHYWPDLWKVNTDVPIMNPHLIYPGQRIRLFRKGELPAASSPAPGGPPSGAEISVPPEMDAMESAGLSDIGEMPALAMPEISRKGDYVYPSIARIGFLRPREEPPLGEIFKVRDDKVLISRGDTVYIRQMGEEPLEISKKYTLYRTYKPLVDKRTGMAYGIQHLLTGVVEIESIMPDFVIGRIHDGYRSISVKDRLMPFSIRTPVIPPAAPVEGLSGRLIMGEERSFLLGEYSVVFLDKGENDGMKTGQIYDLFTMNKVKTGQDGHEDLYSEVDVSVGSVLVLHTEPETITGVVIRSLRSFHAGVGFRSRL